MNEAKIALLPFYIEYLAVRYFLDIARYACQIADGKTAISKKDGMKHQSACRNKPYTGLRPIKVKQALGQI